MKKNEELKHHHNNEKLSKKNYVIIIVPIILIIILTISIALFVFIITNPSNRLKKYLIKQDYNCNSETCTKKISDDNYTIDYKKGYLYIDNDIYHLTISNTSPLLEVKETEYICTYSNANYETFTKVDNTFMYNRQCETYINDINKKIDFYHNIFIDSGIDVNKLEK